MSPQRPERKNIAVLQQVCMDACSGKYTPDSLEERFSRFIKDAIAFGEERLRDKRPDAFLFFVRDCPRCGKNHDTYVSPLTNSGAPIVNAYWGVCAQTDQPLLLTIVPEERP